MCYSIFSGKISNFEVFLTHINPVEYNMPLLSSRIFHISLLDEDDKKRVVENTVQDELIHMKPRISKRQKKPPTTKSENFLW